FVVLTVALGARRMDVSWFGKAGTFGMMMAFPAFLAAADEGLSEPASNVFLAIAWISGLPALVFSMIAFVGYMRNGVQALREGREMRAADDASRPPRLRPGGTVGSGTGGPGKWPVLPNPDRLRGRYPREGRHHGGRRGH